MKKEEEKKYLIDQVYALMAVIEKEFLQEETNKEESDEFVDIFKEICKSGIPFSFSMTPSRLVTVYLYDKDRNKIWDGSGLLNDYNELIRKFIEAILEFYPDSEFAMRLNNQK